MGRKVSLYRLIITFLITITHYMRNYGIYCDKMCDIILTQFFLNIYRKFLVQYTDCKNSTLLHALLSVDLGTAHDLSANPIYPTSTSVSTMDTVSNAIAQSTMQRWCGFNSGHLAVGVASL